MKLTDSPVPRYDLLSAGKYLYYYVQTTRGCPFQCEFCDIIVTDGRVPRTKTVEQVHGRDRDDPPARRRGTSRSPTPT